MMKDATNFSNLTVHKPSCSYVNCYKKFGKIGLAVLTYIGHTQTDRDTVRQTDRQTD